MCQHIPLKFFFKNSIFIEGAQNMSVLWGKYNRIRKLRSFLCLFFWPGHGACGILAPGLGIEPGPLTVKALSPDHWTARELHFSTLPSTAT